MKLLFLMVIFLYETYQFAAVGNHDQFPPLNQSSMRRSCSRFEQYALGTHYMQQARQSTVRNVEETYPFTKIYKNPLPRIQRRKIHPPEKSRFLKRKDFQPVKSESTGAVVRTIRAENRRVHFAELSTKS